jgi:hypothetical protein
MSHGARNWPFFTLTARPSRRGDQEVGLAAEERRDLQHVDDLRGGAHCSLAVHVGQDGDAAALLDCRAISRRAEARPRADFALVRFALSKLDLKTRVSRAPRDLGEAFRPPRGPLARLEDARPGDQKSSPPPSFLPPTSMLGRVLMSRGSESHGGESVPGVRGRRAAIVRMDRELHRRRAERIAVDLAGDR